MARNPFARLSGTCAARSPRARCDRQPRVRAVNAAPALTPTPTPSASAAIGARHVFKAAVDVIATPCRGDDDATRLELRVGARPPRPARSRGLGRARDRESELVRLRRVGTGSFRRLGARAQTRSSSRSVWSSVAGFTRVPARNARAARAVCRWRLPQGSLVRSPRRVAISRLIRSIARRVLLEPEELRGRFREPELQADDAPKRRRLLIHSNRGERDQRSYAGAFDGARSPCRAAGASRTRACAPRVVCVRSRVVGRLWAARLVGESAPRGHARS